MIIADVSTGDSTDVSTDAGSHGVSGLIGIALDIYLLLAISSVTIFCSAKFL